MANVDAIVSGVSALLQSYTGTANFVTVRDAQFHSLKDVIEQQTLTLQYAASLVNRVKTMPFTESQLNDLMRVINERTSGAAELQAVQNGNVRSKLQDYTMIGNALPASFWEARAQGAHESVLLHQLATHCSKLGLANPSEQTYCVLHLLVSQDEQRDLPLSAQFEIFKVNKAKFKKFFEAQMPLDMQPPVSLPAVPENIVQPWHKKAFSNEGPAPPPADVWQSIQNAAMNFPKRSSSINLRSVGQHPYSRGATGQMQQMMQGFQMLMSQHALQQQQTGLNSIPLEYMHRRILGANPSTSSSSSPRPLLQLTNEPNNLPLQLNDVQPASRQPGEPATLQMSQPATPAHQFLGARVVQADALPLATAEPRKPKSVLDVACLLESKSEEAEIKKAVAAEKKEAAAKQRKEAAAIKNEAAELKKKAAAELKKKPAGDKQAKGKSAAVKKQMEGSAAAKSAAKESAAKESAAANDMPKAAAKTAPVKKAKKMHDGIAEELQQQYLNGCAKCRNSKYCTKSCYKYRKQL